jgi:hypothetical protein
MADPGSPRGCSACTSIAFIILETNGKIVEARNIALWHLISWSRFFTRGYVMERHIDHIEEEAGGRYNTTRLELHALKIDTKSRSA